MSVPVDFGLMFIAPALIEFASDFKELTFEVDMSPRRVDLAGEGFDLAIRVGDLANSATLVTRRLAAVGVALYAAPSYLSCPFQKFTHVFSSRHLQVLALRILRTHSCDQRVEFDAGELPFERPRDALEVALEVREPLGDRLQAREVVWRERLALDDREVDLDLVEPTRGPLDFGTISDG